MATQGHDIVRGRSGTGETDRQVLHPFLIVCRAKRADESGRYVDYVMHRVRMLRHFGVTPYLVFDGDYLPSKARTEAEREK